MILKINKLLKGVKCMDEKTYKIVYFLKSEDSSPGNITGVTLVEAVNRYEAIYKFQQSGVRYNTIKSVEEL